MLSSYYVSWSNTGAEMTETVLGQSSLGSGDTFLVLQKYF